MKFRLLIFSMIFLLHACKKEDPILPNEEEVITSITYTLTPSGGGTPKVFSFQDLDGDGGMPPAISGDTLEAMTTYTGSVLMLNSQANPVINVTEEVLEEDEDHQLFFVSSVPILQITYSDADANGNPLGLETIANTTTAGQGSLVIILRHEPNKSAPGVAEGDPANAGGETDIEVSFPLVVQ